MNVLPCGDGCLFDNKNIPCEHIADCRLDVETGSGLYYFWEKGKSKPTRRSGGDAEKPMIAYRKRKFWESDIRG